MLSEGFSHIGYVHRIVLYVLTLCMGGMGIAWQDTGRIENEVSSSSHESSSGSDAAMDGHR